MIRYIVTILSAVILLLNPGSGLAQALQSQPGMKPINAEMRALLASDDIDHADDSKIDFVQIAHADQTRWSRVRDLLIKGKLKNGGDFRAAAFIFQHGSSTDDYLLAHALALTAVSLGDHKALWIANASLDRYLMTIGQKQIFGTQYAQQDGPDRPFTQEPYNRDLVPDAIRKKVGIKTLSNQALFLETLENRRASALAGK